MKKLLILTCTAATVLSLNAFADNSDQAAIAKIQQQITTVQNSIAPAIQAQANVTNTQIVKVQQQLAAQITAVQNQVQTLENTMQKEIQQLENQIAQSKK